MEEGSKLLKTIRGKEQLTGTYIERKMIRRREILKRNRRREIKEEKPHIENNIKVTEGSNK